MECPKCKSDRMDILPWLGVIYQCRKCGYRGPLTIRKDKKPSKI